ncbi:MAG: hypothetical protein HEQ35_31275 [Gloeotrichia echinulata IR180]|jgi:putative transposase
MSNYGCQQVLISPDKELRAILEFICEQSNKLANCGLYYSRQLFFKTGKIPSQSELHRLLKSNVHFQALYSHVAQQTLTTVFESFRSFIALLKGFKNGTVEQRPKLPIALPIQMRYKIVSRDVGARHCRALTDVPH